MRRTIALIHARERAKAAETLARDNLHDVAPEHRQAMIDHGFQTAAWEAVAALARLLELAQPPAGEDADRLREQARRALAAMRAAHPSR